jgi:signal transduction histidine kinase
MLDEGYKKFIFEFSREFDKFLELYKEEKKRNSNFMSNLSHEIRNPLTIIKSSLQLLEKQIDGLENNFYLQSIYDEVSFIDDILTQISSYGKNDKRMIFEDVCIGSIVSNVANSYSSIVERDKKVLKVDIEQPLHKVKCDGTSMRQVITNLIKNAVEATKEGDSIFVSVCRIDGYTQIQVKDTGMGIEKERLASIYEPFVTTKSCGTGLGLAVVKNLVEAHCGKIEVDSVVGEGTTFTITLPND